MRVLHVASEVAPWAQSGGLADVVAGLPAALAAAAPELDVAVLAPLYRGVAGRLASAGLALGDGFAHDALLGPHLLPVRVRPVVGATGGAALWFVESPLYDRDGFYHVPGGPDFADNHVRFGLLGRVAVDVGDRLVGGPVDVLHAHDWQAGLAPALLRLDPAHAATAAIVTIHNLAFRGLFPASAVGELGLPWSLFHHRHAEFYGHLSFLKAGAGAADAVTTVSPTYAHEILTPARGEALDGFLRHDVQRVVGIVNGIDDEAWNPARDPALAAPYTAVEPAGKARCRAALADELGLAIADDTPVLGVVSRFADQKGLDLVADIAPELHRLGARLVVLGSGDPGLERRFLALADLFRDELRVFVGFDVGLSRRIYAGSDLFLMPSRFEPCGLSQMYAMRYGSIPVVHAVGGLVDTVDDPGDAGLAAGGGTGFRFEHPTADGLLWALGRGVAMFRTPAWAALVGAAMRRDSSWRGPARDYLELYRLTLRSRA